MIPETITDEYLCNEPECQYFDRKSARIKPSDIAKHLVAFANANGGVLAIGIEDSGDVTGFEIMATTFGLPIGDSYLRTKNAAKNMKN